MSDWSYITCNTYHPSIALKGGVSCSRVTLVEADVVGVLFYLK